MAISRRAFLRAGLATAGGVALARPFGALALPLGPSPQFTTARESRLFPGTYVAHADLHNHSLHSDGDGDPALAFGLIRGAGLDIAALTDHSTLSWGLPQNVCPDSDCQSVAGVNEQTWAEAAEIAAAHNDPPNFIAIRGFEWSSPTIGHMNVWFSQRWMDPLHTAGGGTGEGAAQFLHELPEEDDRPPILPAEQMAALDAIVKAAPHTGLGMAAFYEWLAASPERPVWSGGSDGVASFNHPGREPGRFSSFSRLGLPAPPNVVALEIFNRREDYIFEGTAFDVEGEIHEGIAQSPLNECLNAGWVVGLSGVTDEHGTDWGSPIGKGRSGLWMSELSESGIKDAMRARRFFATRERGLRLDATANGVQMGDLLSHTSGPVRFVLDIDHSDWGGRELNVQVLRSGPKMPAVQDNVAITVPGELDPPVEFTLPVDAVDGDWVVLRITDPSEAADARALGAWQTYGRALAYCSPFFLR